MPASSIVEVIDQLNNIIAKATAENNRAGYFAALYKKVTVAVAENIKAGYFDDNERMEKLDVAFANRYLEAHENYFQNKPCSASWRLAFDACKDWQPMVMHHLLTGMNAHIGLDLGIAAASVSPAGAIENIHNDFNKINIVLGNLVTEVRAELYSMWPLSKLITMLNASKLETDLAGFSMNIARDAAWQVALNYSALSTTGTQQNYIAARDKSVEGFGNELLHPGNILQTASAIFRVFEFGTVGGKIKKLDERL